MQQSHCASAMTYIMSFSIHKRIEGGATNPELVFVNDDVVFQYPQADRRGCNKLIWTTRPPAVVRFSIHKRIEGGATSPETRRAVLKILVSVSTSGSKGVQLLAANVEYIRSEAFQYPQADRRGCNHPSPNRQTATSGFQYPQADRRGCNWGDNVDPPHNLCVSVSTSGSKGVQPSGGATTTTAPPGFSIHKRIEGGATRGALRRERPQRLGFSIHKRIEGGATP